MNGQKETIKANSAERVLKSDLSFLLKKLLDNLTVRGRQVIAGRFNLDGNGFKTLEEIGRECGITRERIRQIQAESLQKLKVYVKAHRKYTVIMEGALNILKKNGGAMSENDLLKEAFDKKAGINVAEGKIEFMENDSVVNKNILSLFLEVDNKLFHSREKDNLKKFLALSAADAEFVIGLIGAVKNILDKKKRLMDYKAIIEEIGSENLFKGKNISAISLKAYLGISKSIAKNPFGYLGISDWEEVKPKGVRGKIYLILKNSGKPLHFGKITGLINKTVWAEEKEKNIKKIARSETVHNELIKDKRFVLVGRGTYALKEWGYISGTVSEVILRILSEGKLMSKDDIVKEVLKERFVKVNTIIFNLHNSGYFERNGDLYQLKPKIASLENSAPQK